MEDVFERRVSPSRGKFGLTRQRNFQVARRVPRAEARRSATGCLQTHPPRGSCASPFGGAGSGRRADRRPTPASLAKAAPREDARNSESAQEQRERFRSFGRVVKKAKEIAKSEASVD